MKQISRNTDFTKGSIPRHLVLFTIPMIIGNLLQALYNTVDSIWVGRFLGKEALSAVTVSFPISFTLIALALGLTQATTTLVSQYFGAGDMREVRKTIANSLVILSILAAIISVVGILARFSLLRLINVPPDVMELAASYLQIYLTGLVPMFIFNAISAILRGLGDSRSPLVFLAYATITNIILDPIMIFGVGPIPKMGVAGAALATVIAQTLSAILALRYLIRADLLRLGKEMFYFDKRLTWITFRIGIPAGLQQVLVSLSGLAVSSIINRFGSSVVAGFGVGQKIDQFAFLPAMSMGVAVSALVGQNLGAQRVDRVYESVKWSTILGGGITGCVALFVLAFPGFLVSFFTTDANVLAVGTMYLRILSFAYVAFALMFTFGGVLRGAGDTIPTMLVTLISLWMIRIPLAYYLSTIRGLGERGAFLAIMFSPMVGVLLNYIYYKTGYWKRHKLTERSLQLGSVEE
ncbi:MAG: MATE family efflux transporter [Firmicutes bacterium]|nr:MATE family efflux transporter [Bacillota bacterium]